MTDASQSKPTLSIDPDCRAHEYLRHLVALHWIDVRGRSDDEVGPRSQCVSGFVMSVKGQWVWVTAGHICEAIGTMVAQGREIRRLRFYDVWANPHHHPEDTGIPLTWALPLPHIHDESRGIDYGAMVIDQHTRTLLTNGGIIPLDERWWADVPENIEAYQMVGIPTELSKSSVEETSGTTTITTRIRPCVAPISLAPDPPDECLVPFSRFYGYLMDKTPEGLPNGVPLNDIDGMSGSPIFGLKRNDSGSLDYWLLAIQSSWYRNQRLICGCPAAGIAYVVTHAIEQLERKGDEAGT